MKKILLFILLSVSILCAGAQCTKPYKAFAEFNKDITAFLSYNFKERADCYKGKTVADVLKDMELKPAEFVPLSSTYVDKYRGIFIYVNNLSSFDLVIKGSTYFFNALAFAKVVVILLCLIKEHAMLESIAFL